MALCGLMALAPPLGLMASRRPSYFFLSKLKPQTGPNYASEGRSTPPKRNPTQKGAVI
jgi:hypothetical protein